MKYFLVIVLLLASTIDATAREQRYRPARLHDGRPDLQGVWAATNLTPFTRPKNIEALIITPEQARQIERQRLAEEEDRTTPTEPTEYFDTRRIERVDGELRSSIIIDPPNGQLPGNAQLAEAFRRFRIGMAAPIGPESRAPSERCLPAPTAQPPLMPWPSNSLVQIVQTAGIVAIHAEAIHDARIIRINAKHAPAAMTSWLGDSIGWWDGDAFVVQTKHFHPDYPVRSAPGYRFLISSQAVVTERFTRLSKDELLYEFTVDDPIYYTQTWRGESHFLRTTDPIFEYACHEGNYSLPSMLEAARQLDAPAR